MKYMIHACNQRMWYVDNFLMPSLIKQGINKDDIYVYLDKDRDGNLKSYIKSSKLVYEMWGDNENVWHLQDDVIVCSNFKERTEELEAREVDIICGFTCFYDDGRKPGLNFPKDHMWYSFPCMRVPSKISKEFADWTDTYLWRDNQFGFWTRYKKGDDYVFRIWVESYYPYFKVLNLAPNLIDHVDFLLGGTIVNPQREAQSVDVRSMYFDEKWLVDELAEEIKKYDTDNR